MNPTWALGQSEVAREICRNLTPWEKAGLYGLSFLLGIFGFVIPVVLMGSATGAFPFFHAIEGYAFPLLVCLGVGFWGILVLQRRLLLATQVAKNKGYTMADLRVRRAYARKEYLAMGVGAGVVLAIGVAAAVVISQT